VIGVDEVGRGCLAGPVVAAAVILKQPYKRRIYRDSKLVSEPRREELYKRIVENYAWCVGIASVEEIEEINILRASLLAMRRAVLGLKIKCGHILVDGRFVIPNLKGFQQTALIQGDLRAENISAASIVAKVTRDRMMRELAEKFPHYGFEENKGYGTLHHRRALAQVGACEHHRKSFNGVLPEELADIEG
jgi:ribonuclease HII